MSKELNIVLGVMVWIVVPLWIITYPKNIVRETGFVGVLLHIYLFFIWPIIGIIGVIWGLISAVFEDSIPLETNNIETVSKIDFSQATIMDLEENLPPIAISTNQYERRSQMGNRTFVVDGVEVFMPEESRGGDILRAAGHDPYSRQLVASNPNGTTELIPNNQRIKLKHQGPFSSQIPVAGGTD